MRIVITILLFLGVFGCTFAQDIHFSHIHASPLQLNPSMTGLINEGTGRIILNSKGQWNSITNAYKTIAASYDMKLYAKKGSLVSGGFQVHADKAGDLGLSTIKTAVSASFIRSLDFDDNYLISVGVNAGRVTNRIDYTKMIGFDDEPLVALGMDDKISYWDYGVGLSYFANISEYSMVYLGGAYWHFNTPDVSFSQSIRTGDEESKLQRERLYAKKVVNGGGSFKIAPNMWFQPSFLFMDQGPHQEINTGTFLKYLKSKKRNKKVSVYLGAWLRWYLENDIRGIDAAVASVRMDLNKTYMTLSYDINLSTYKRASHGAGGLELSLIHILEMTNYSRRLSPVCCPKI